MDPQLLEMMYTRQPQRIHLELTNQCNAKCPMCERTNPNGLDSIIKTKHQLSLDVIKKAFGNACFRQINYCGNVGDPLMHPDVLEIVKFFEPSRQLIHTNGSLQTKSFWQQLAQIKNVVVIFGIDGTTEETHQKYRVNTCLKKILSNAKIFNDAGGNSWWQFIVFRHNQHQLEEAENMAKMLGFSKFERLFTRRFYENPQFNYTFKEQNVTLYPIKKTTSSPSNTINCKAKQLEEIYVTASGDVYPCAYVASEKKPTPLNINNSSFNEMYDNPYFEDILQFPLGACLFNCKDNIKNVRERSTI